MIIEQHVQFIPSHYSSAALISILGKHNYYSILPHFPGGNIDGTATTDNLLADGGHAHPWFADADDAAAAVRLHADHAPPGTLHRHARQNVHPARGKYDYNEMACTEVEEKTKIFGSAVSRGQ